MKRLFFFSSLAMINLLANHSYAYEIYKGKVSHHKEWSTGKAKGSFKSLSHYDLKNKKIDFEKNYDLRTSLYPQKVASNSIARINGYNYISISNDTPKTTNFNIHAMACADTSTDTQDCISIIEQVDLEPNGWYINGIEPNLEVIFNQAGNYNTFFRVIIFTQDDALSSTSRSYVQVL